MVNFKNLSPWTWIVHNDPNSRIFKEENRCENYYALLYLGIMGENDFVVFPIVFDLIKNNQSHLENIESSDEIFDKSYSPGNIKDIENWLSKSSTNLRIADENESEILDNALLDLGIQIDKDSQTIKNTRSLSVRSLEEYLYDNILDKLNSWEV